MTDHPHSCYADHAWHGTVHVDENVRLARDTYRVRFACPQIAARVLPGQFVMLRLAGRDDPLLGRPFAVYDVVLDDAGRPRGLDVIYLAVGRMTRRLVALAPGERLEVWGPLGRGFAPLSAEHVLIVAGGIGQTPFLMVARECLGLARYGEPPCYAPRARAVTLCYGARTKEYFAAVDDFRAAGVDVLQSTDDGSLGHHGPVTDLIEPVARKGASQPEGPIAARIRIVCCGPEPMMEATAKIARRLGIPCQVSLETPMACGLGICFSCVARIRDASGVVDYRRTCVEGPVFDAADVEFATPDVDAYRLGVPSVDPSGDKGT